MEKFYKVTMTIKNASGQFANGKDPHYFLRPARDEETAKFRSIIDAYNQFPREDGWTYEITSVEEKSRDDVADFLFGGKSLI